MQKTAAVKRYRDRALNTGYLFSDAKALMVAAKLGVFDHIGTGSKSPTELAKAIRTSVRGLGLLLDALAGMGYIDKKGKRYSNTRYGLPERLRQRSGIPTLAIDGDLNDLRCYSEEQTITKIEAFLEQLAGC